MYKVIEIDGVEIGCSLFVEEYRGACTWIVQPDYEGESLLMHITCEWDWREEQPKGRFQNKQWWFEAATYPIFKKESISDADKKIIMENVALVKRGEEPKGWMV